MADRRHEFVSKSWGYEEWFENNDKYCGKLLTVIRQQWSSKGNYHYHKIKDETFYVIEGILLLIIVDDKQKGSVSIKLNKGESYRVKPGILHKFTALTYECKFIEVSTTHSDEDSYRVG
jgi:mannose-6-phosphate isomerase-like protein (cupin superfamily)